MNWAGAGAHPDNESLRHARHWVLVTGPTPLFAERQPGLHEVGLVGRGQRRAVPRRLGQPREQVRLPGAGRGLPGGRPPGTQNRESGEGDPVRGSVEWGGRPPGGRGVPLLAEELVVRRNQRVAPALDPLRVVPQHLPHLHVRAPGRCPGARAQYWWILVG